MPTFGSVTHAAFVPGHSTWVLPISKFLAAKHSVLAGRFILDSNSRHPTPCPYFFHVLDNGGFEITCTPREDVDYGAPWEIPDRIIAALKKGDALPDGISDREQELLIAKFAEQIGGVVKNLTTVEATLNGKPYEVKLQLKG